MKSLICPECGTENKRKATFCKVCGSYLKKSALKEEFERAKYEMKKFVDERIDETIYPKIIEIKKTFEEEKKRFNTEIGKILKKNEKEIIELKKSFVKETSPLIKNLELLEINEEKIKNIDKLEKKLDKVEGRLQGLEKNVSGIKRFIGDEIKSINYALRESIESYIEQMINDLKDVFELRFNSLLKRIEKIESYKKKLEHVDIIYEKFSKGEKKLEDLKSEISRIKRNFDERIKKVNENITENTKMITSDLENLKEKVKSADLLSNKIEDLEGEKTKIDLLNNKINENKENLNSLAEEISKMKENFDKQINDISTDLREIIEKNTENMINKLKQSFESRFDSILERVERDEIDREKLKTIDSFNSEISENKKRLDELINEVSGMKRTFDKRIEDANANLKQNFESKIDSLSKKIGKIKIDEEKIKNIDGVEKKTEENAGKVEELTRLVTQAFDTLNNIPSQKTFHDSFSEVNQQIFTLGEKIKHIEEKIKRMQSNTQTDYLRLETVVKNTETNVGKLQKRIDLILKKVDEIRTSPAKGLIKKQREMEKKISKLEKEINEKLKTQKKEKRKESKGKSKTKIKPSVREKKIKKKTLEKEIGPKVEEIKNKIVEKTKDIILHPVEIKPKESLEVENVDVSEKKNIEQQVERGKHKEKEKSKEKPEEEKEKILICKYCHRSFNNQRLLEMHEMLCEKRP
jgi:DNA repair exonuclease SbcCD ATPase subunit